MPSALKRIEGVFDLLQAAFDVRWRDAGEHAVAARVIAHHGGAIVVEPARQACAFPRHCRTRCRAAPPTAWRWRCRSGPCRRATSAATRLARCRRAARRGCRDGTSAQNDGGRRCGRAWAGPLPVAAGGPPPRRCRRKPPGRETRAGSSPQARRSRHRIAENAGRRRPCSSLPIWRRSGCGGSPASLAGHADAPNDRPAPHDYLPRVNHAAAAAGKCPFLGPIPRQA